MKKYLIFFIIILGLGVIINSSNFKKSHGSEPVDKQQIDEHWILPTEGVLTTRELSQQGRNLGQIDASLNRQVKQASNVFSLHPKSKLDHVYQEY